MMQKNHRRCVATGAILVSLATLACLSSTWFKNERHNNYVVLNQTKNITDALDQEREGDSQNLVIEEGVVKGFKNDYKPTDLDLVIPAKTKDGPVVRIDKHAFKNQNGIRTVQIENGIKEIGFQAFASCKNLEKIVIPSSVTEISAYALSYCPWLKTSGVINRSGVLFDWWVRNHRYDGQTLDKMEIINLVEYRNSDGKPFHTIGCNAFSTCEKLKNLFLPSSITQLDEYLFWTADKDYRLPVETVHIGANNLSLKPVTFYGLNNTCEYYVNSPAAADHLIHARVERAKINIARDDFYTKQIDGKTRLCSLTPQGERKTVLTIPSDIDEVSWNVFDSFSKDLKSVVVNGYDTNFEAHALAQLPLHVNFEVFSRQMKARLIEQQINPARIKFTSLASNNRYQVDIMWQFKHRRQPLVQTESKTGVIATSVILGMIVAGLIGGTIWLLIRRYKK